MNVLPDILSMDSDLDYVESQDDIEPAQQSKSVAQSRDKNPVATTSDSRKRQVQNASSDYSKTKAWKSDSGVILHGDKRSHSSRASTGDVGRQRKTTSQASMQRKSVGSGKVKSDREEDSIRVLLAERKRLEKENKERKRQLEELKKQEMLIEAAAKKGAPFEKQLGNVNLKSGQRSKLSSHKDLAGNVFATMDRDLAASSEEGEEKVDSCNDDHRPPELQPDPENSSVAHSDDLASPSYSENPDDASIDKEHDDGDGDASISSGSGESDIESGADNDNGDIASDASDHRAKASTKTAASPVHRKKSDAAEGGSGSENFRRKRSSDTKHEELSQTEKLLRYIFLDAKFFLIKSGNHENVGLAQARGVWSSPPPNEARLNHAFRSCSNVIVVFSVKGSRRFQGFARLATESDKNHPPIRWVLPPGMSASCLSGVFTLDWINRKELDFSLVSRLRNSWNENYPVQVGRDGQAIEPVVGEDLCRLFPVDNQVDLYAIALKSRDAMAKHGLNPHEEYKRAELRRRQIKTKQRRRERWMQADKPSLIRGWNILAYEARWNRSQYHSLPRYPSQEFGAGRMRAYSPPRRSDSSEFQYGRMRAFPRRRSDSSEFSYGYMRAFPRSPSATSQEMRQYGLDRSLGSMHPISPPVSYTSSRRPSISMVSSSVDSRRSSYGRPRSFSRGSYEQSRYSEHHSRMPWDRQYADHR